MGLFDKVKSLFTEEVEEEEEQPIKKEVIKVEIPSPNEKKEEVKKESEEPISKSIDENDNFFNDDKEEFSIRTDNNFPFFDDEEFSSFDKKSKKREERKKNTYKETYKEKKEVYNPIKEEKRVFKPSPIISPVYGILDKNYQREEIKSKSVNHYNSKEATVDEIRNKAYGTLEDDIETTLFGRDEDNFEEDITKDDILKATIRDEREKDIAKDDSEEFSTRTRMHKTRSSLDMDDFVKDDTKNEKKEKPRKISDEELFNMIDSMYQKGDKE